MKLKMKLGTRIKLGFGCLILLVVIMAFFAIYNMYLMDGKIAIVENRDRKLNVSTSMERSVLIVSRGIRGVMAGFDLDENKQSVSDGLKVYNNAFAEAQETFYTKDGRARLARVKELSAVAIPLMNQLLESGQSGKGQSLVDVNEASIKIKEWTSEITQMEHICERDSKEAIVLIRQTYIHSLALLIIIAIIAIILGIGLASYIASSITGSMNSIASKIGESSGQVAAASGQLSSA
ncbi:MAG TPA: hypothetical protein DDW50_09750, partial [Firmicutes bacterium]|nr:hypothetical protein [Bacillota bacterium]